MKVRSPDGRQWRIGRRWLPRRPRLGRVDTPDLGGADLPDFDLGDDLGVLATIGLAIIGVIVAVFLALVLFNVIAIAIELTLVIVLLVAGLVGRVVFRRPWQVVARSGDESHSWRVVGWLRSRRVIADVAGQLETGTREPRPAEALDPAPR
jgi:hypothetical protein